jgi:hypothetical protein
VTSGTTSAFHVQYTSTNTIQVFAGSYFSHTLPSGSFYSQSFYHIVVTFTYLSSVQTTCRLYINGALATSSTLSFSFIQPANFFIGHRTDNADNYFPAFIDQFRFYTGILSSNDVAKLYNNGVGI